MFRRFELPALERLSLLLRISICVFYGVMGLPIPFRQRLSYVIGDPILPPQSTQPRYDAQYRDGDTTTSGSLSAADKTENTKTVDDMHKRFCDELIRIFDSHKEAYGWGHKSLKLISR